MPWKQLGRKNRGVSNYRISTVPFRLIPDPVFFFFFRPRTFITLFHSDWIALNVF